MAERQFCLYGDGVVHHHDHSGDEMRKLGYTLKMRAAVLLSSHST